MRLLDRINERSLETLSPDFVILNFNSMAQLLDEVEAETGVMFSQNDLIDFLGMHVVLSSRQKEEFILAVKCE